MVRRMAEEEVIEMVEKQAAKLGDLGAEIAGTNLKIESLNSQIGKLSP